MTAIVLGEYKDGRIELLEAPEGVREGRVRVLLIEEGVSAPLPRYLVRGKYRGPKDPTLDDFKVAEWRDESDGG